MSNAETRALGKAAVALLVLSLIRWTGTINAGASVGPQDDALAGLAASSAAALQDADRRAAPFQPGERLDPNRAPAEELDRLPGVGRATADAIVLARTSGGAFHTAADLARVPGIGPVLVQRIAPHLDLDSPPLVRGSKRRPGPERVDLNRASAEDLTVLPGIGPALAARILEARKERPFTSAEDLLGVRGIGPATLQRLRPLVQVGLHR